MPQLTGRERTKEREREREREREDSENERREKGGGRKERGSEGGKGEFSRRSMSNSTAI